MLAEYLSRGSGRHNRSAWSDMKIHPDAIVDNLFAHAGRLLHQLRTEHAQILIRISHMSAIKPSECERMQRTADMYAGLIDVCEKAMIVEDFMS